MYIQEEKNTGNKIVILTISVKKLPKKQKKYLNKVFTTKNISDKIYVN